MAYLDPGSGSFILQLLIAAVLGGLIALRAYWGKVKKFMRGIFTRNNQDEADEEVE